MKVSNWIANILAKRKAAQLLRVADSAFALGEAQYSKFVPAIFALYRELVATVIVETEKSPDALYALIAAFENVAKQYGPQLKDVVVQYGLRVEAAATSCGKEQAALMAAITELNDEVQA